MSSYVLSAVSPRSFATSARRPALLEGLGLLFEDSRAEVQARRVAVKLMALSDRQLLDIGIDRDEIARIARSGRR